MEQLQRSPIYDELVDHRGRLPQWADFVKHVANVQDFAALSEHRTLVADMLRLRGGEPPAYDWTDGDGSLPFSEVTDLQLMTLAQDLQESVTGAFKESLRLGEVSMNGSSDVGQWFDTPSGITWLSHGPPINDPEASWPPTVMGRGLRLRCPVESQSTPLLFPTYENVVAAITVFGRAPFPPFDEVDTAVRSLLRSIPQHIRLDTCLDVCALRLDDLQSTGSAEVRVDLSIVSRGTGQPTITAATAYAETLTQSPLAGLPQINTIALRALHQRQKCDDFLLLDETGLVREFGRGALVWRVGETWSTPDARTKPTSNPLIERGLRREVLKPGNLARNDVATLLGPVYRVTSCGAISAVSVIDGRSVPLVDEAGTVLLTSLLGLLGMTRD